MGDGSRHTDRGNAEKDAGAEYPVSVIDHLKSSFSELSPV
jgi:hypothetical protein